MQCYLKSKLKSCKICVKELIFSTDVGPHLANLLKNVTHLSKVVYEKNAQTLRKQIFKDNAFMVVSFKTVQIVWIKNQCSATYMFRINANSRSCRNSIKKIFFGRSGIKHFNHPRTGHKQFFEVAFMKNPCLYKETIIKLSAACKTTFSEDKYSKKKNGEDGVIT